MAKTVLQGLISEEIKRTWALVKETEGLNIIKPNFQGLESKTIYSGRRVLI
jgi:hypothetical protein